MKSRNLYYFVVLSALTAILCLQSTMHAATDATITVTPSTTYQTMTGWEIVDYNVMAANSAKYGIIPDVVQSMVFDRAVNEIGIDRVRLEIFSGAENTTDTFGDENNSNCWYSTVNDNSDPNVLNMAGFSWNHLDFNVDHIVTPLRQRLQARGEHLFINLNYVSFLQAGGTSRCPGVQEYDHTNPAEYAEFMLAAFTHLKAKYGWVPDAIEVILEPDNTYFWRGTQIGNAIVATAQRLDAAGFAIPKFIAPSNTSMSNVPPYYDAIKQVPGALQYLDTISYHRYASTDLTAIVQRAQTDHKKTAMLEWWSNGNDFRSLHNDLKVGMNSAHQQETIVGYSEDRMLLDLNYDDPSNPLITVAPYTRYTRHYYEFVRQGAVRVGAQSTSSLLDPLAFRNTDGKFVVVAIADTGGGKITVNGLPGGTYGVKYTSISNSNQNNISNPDVTIANGQALTTILPYSAVVTLYAKTPPAQSASITSIDPHTVNAGSGGFTLTVNGTGFGPSSVVALDAVSLQTTFVSSTLVRASVPAGLIATAGTRLVSVDGSATVPLMVHGAPPTITSINPNTVDAGSAGFTLTVNGSGFGPSSVVAFDSVSLQTTFISSTVVLASVPAGLIATVGPRLVSVDGSSTLTLTVRAAPPPPASITSISPNTVDAGSAQFTLSVNGTSFQQNSAVFLDSVQLATTFQSSTMLRALVPADLVATPGTKLVKVDASAAVQLTVRAVADTPVFDPGSAAYGASYLPGLVPGSWAQVKGTKLSSTTRIWNESDFVGANTLPTSLDGVQLWIGNLPAAIYYISPTQVSFQVPAGLSGQVTIRVVRDGASSEPITAEVVASAPALFGYSAGGMTYPAAVFAGTSVVVGDPAVAGNAAREAHPGERVSLYATGLTSSPAGVVVGVAGVNGVTVTIGGTAAVVEFAGLVTPGLFQINIIVPQLPPGGYEVKIQINGLESQDAILFPILS